ncbi:MAG TPA: hypothetical protein VGQ91_02780 [Ideonella sp.]|nr:hypothetical protein [Ideonella sp.]
MNSRDQAGYTPRRRPAAGLVVLALHLLLAALLWQTLRQREVAVRREQAPLVWVQPLPAQPPPRPAPSPRPQAAAAATPKRQAPALPITTPPHESTWVQPAPPVAAAPAASAASDVPPLRLLDTEGTRAAIRQTGRQALLQERAAQATDTTIARTDTELAAGVAHAGLPDCMKDPNAAVGHIGPIALGGILGLPFLAARVATGKCAK